MYRQAEATDFANARSARERNLRELQANNNATQAELDALAARYNESYKRITDSRKSEQMVQAELSREAAERARIAVESRQAALERAAASRKYWKKLKKRS